MLQRAGSHVVSKGFIHKVRLPGDALLPVPQPDALEFWSSEWGLSKYWLLLQMVGLCRLKYSNLETAEVEVSVRVISYLCSLTMQECPLQPIGVQPSATTHGHGFWSQMDPDSNPDSDSYRL